MSEDKRAFMERAMDLARLGAGLVSPNPMVGAVIVREGRIIGEGFHRYELLNHAESYALEMAGPPARGATLYCNLEPCCHQGRTPPCTDALIEAGIKGVVVAIVDPDPRVNGGGIRQLADAGVSVEVGLCEVEAARLNESYLKYAATGAPFVHAVAWRRAPDAGSRGTAPETNSEALAWLPSSTLAAVASQYDAVVLGESLRVNRAIVEACLSKHRHRPLVIAGDLARLSSFGRPGLSGADRQVSLLLLDPEYDERTRSHDEGPVSPSGPEAWRRDPAVGARCRGLAASVLECLAGMQVTSVLVLPAGLDFGTGPDCARVDRWTLVLGRELEPEDAGPGLDVCGVSLEKTDFTSESGFTEITGYPSGK